MSVAGSYFTYPCQPTTGEGIRTSLFDCHIQMRTALAGGILLGELGPSPVHAVPDDDKGNSPNVEGKVVYQ